MTIVTADVVFAEGDLAPEPVANREFTRVLSSLSAEVQAQFGKVLARVVTELKELPDRDEVREIVGKELQKREAQGADAKRNKANLRS